MADVASAHLDQASCPATQLGCSLVKLLPNNTEAAKATFQQDAHELISDPSSREATLTVLGAITAIVLQHLFGQPADARKITLQLSAVSQRLAGSDQLPTRQIEALIRTLLGEPWLKSVLDIEQLLAVPENLMLSVWLELVTGCVQDTALDARSLVVAAEEAATSDEVTARLSTQLRDLFSAAATKSSIADRASLVTAVLREPPRHGAT